jgi:predicted CXXCH cytochrome family protein
MSISAFAADKPTAEPETCMTADCHADYKAKAHVHGPVGLGDCKACHESTDQAKHAYKLVREGSKLCEYCHLEQTAKKHTHQPVKDGDCLQCHDPHAAKTKELLKKDTVADLCRQCHQTAVDDKHVHGPVAVGQCSICHQAHGSDHKSLIRGTPEDLCVSCHVTTADEMAKYEFIHEAAKGQCFGCHDPHGADNWKLLKAEAPEMCYSCHEDIQKRAENSKYKHGVIKEKGSCLSCHTPHASTVKFILKDAPTKLCLTCHSKPVGVKQGDIIPAFTDQIEGKKFMHGPLKDKDCGGCHKTHGSDHFRLLDKEYPALFYAPFDKDNYALCFNCHSETLVLDEKTDRLTDFRNGKDNLHYLHVNKDRRGRTCRACHQTHASNQPKHIRETVPYGSWELPLGFGKTETGGTCTPGCHVTKDYDRYNAVDYNAKKLSSEEKAAVKEAVEKKASEPKENVEDIESQIKASSEGK